MSQVHHQQIQYQQYQQRDLFKNPEEHYWARNGSNVNKGLKFFFEICSSKQRFSKSAVSNLNYPSRHKFSDRGIIGATFVIFCKTGSKFAFLL